MLEDFTPLLAGITNDAARLISEQTGMPADMDEEEFKRGLEFYKAQPEKLVEDVKKSGSLASSCAGVDIL